MSDWSPPGNPVPAGERASRPLPGPRDGRGQRGPALVALPRSRVGTDARLVRLRLPDRPGSLAAIAGHLAAHGLNVLRLEVLDRESGWVVDDFLVAGAERRCGPRPACRRRRGARLPARGRPPRSRAGDGRGVCLGHRCIERA